MILDAGCGSGVLNARKIEKKKSRAGRQLLVGVDIHANRRGWHRTIAGELPKFIYQADLSRPPLRRAHFDLILRRRRVISSHPDNSKVFVGSPRHGRAASLSSDLFGKK